jgi:hypothetical protein
VWYDVAADWTRLARWLEDSGANTNVGFIASIIAIAGVLLAAARTRQARRAEAAVRRVRDMDALFRLAATLASLSDLIGNIGLSDRGALAHHGMRLRLALVEITELGSGLLRADRRRIQALITALHELEDVLQDHRAGDEKLLAALASLSMRHEEVYRVLTRLKEQMARRNDAT